MRQWNLVKLSKLLVLKLHLTFWLNLVNKVNLVLPITGKTHGKSEIDTSYEGEFIITHLRHNFDQAERLHTMLMSVTKDSIPTRFKNILSGKEPSRSNGRTINY